jgi:ribosomal protein S18 acetylase RimI-like enzyme
MVKLFDATDRQLEEIRELAHRIWPSAFRGILTSAQISYMLQWMYSLASLQEQVASGHRFLLANENGPFIGYASYQINDQAGTARLHKIYVLPSAQGRGAGTLLLQEVIRRSGAAKQSSLRLNVNRLNNAVCFYKDHGFRIIGEEDNDIGNGYFMNDYVMELIL